MYEVLILPLAQKDIKQASIWYNSKQKGLGNKFTKEVREVVLFIKQNPKACAIRYDKTRTAVLKVFPFMIHYNIMDNTILISAVLHTSRNPEKWLKP